jgi:preprotein translocase subunit YajC
VEVVLPFIVLLGLFYLMIIRPGRNRQKAQQQLLSTIEVGSRVMTTSGLHAEVAGIEDDIVLLEVAPGVVLRFAKPAVARILPEPDPDDPNDLDETGDEETEPAVDEETEYAVDASTDQDSTDRPT